MVWQPNITWDTAEFLKAKSQVKRDVPLVRQSVHRSDNLSDELQVKVLSSWQLRYPDGPRRWYCPYPYDGSNSRTQKQLRSCYRLIIQISQIRAVRKMGTQALTGTEVKTTLRA